MRALPSIPLSLLLAASLALSLWICVRPAFEAEDRVPTFRARSGLSRGVNGSFLNVKADLQVKLDGIPVDFRELQLDGSGLSDRWLDNKQLKLRLYRERDSGLAGYLVLVVETSAVEEGQYRGGYELTVSETADDGKSRTWEAHGDASCSTD